MQKLAAQGVADVTLTGGEAKLIKGFKEIVMAASSLFTNVNVFSNGLNWRQEEIELLSHLEMYLYKLALMVRVILTMH